MTRPLARGWPGRRGLRRLAGGSVAGGSVAGGSVVGGSVAGSPAVAGGSVAGGPAAGSPAAAGGWLSRRRWVVAAALGAVTLAPWVPAASAGERSAACATRSVQVVTVAGVPAPGLRAQWQGSGCATSAVLEVQGETVNGLPVQVTATWQSPPLTHARLHYWLNSDHWVLVPGVRPSQIVEGVRFRLRNGRWSGWLDRRSATSWAPMAPDVRWDDTVLTGPAAPVVVQWRLVESLDDAATINDVVEIDRS